MNLDDELRRLFTDDRLDVPVHAGATEAVLTGARRRRTHRLAAVTATSALVALLVVGGVAIAGGTPDSTPIGPAMPTTTTQGPTTTTSTRPPTVPTTTTRQKMTGTVTATSQPPPATQTGPVVGPDGFSAIKLGMSYDEAAATGELVGKRQLGMSCEVYRTTAHPNVLVTIVAEYGVVKFTLPQGVRNPEGIGVGSSVEDFYAAYPKATRDWRSVGEVPGNPRAGYYMATSVDRPDVISSLALVLDGQLCAS